MSVSLTAVVAGNNILASDFNEIEILIDSYKQLIRDCSSRFIGVVEDVSINTCSANHTYQAAWDQDACSHNTSATSHSPVCTGANTSAQSTKYYADKSGHNKSVLSLSDCNSDYRAFNTYG